jgi:SprB repeat/Secretion system C-terminal sorting domain
MKFFYILGCIFLCTATLPAQLSLQTSSSNVNCFGGSNGSAQATASGGITPYTYRWSNGDSTSNISGLPMGNYTVTATDQAGATASKTVTITQPPLLNVTLNGQPQICAVAPDGFSYAIPTGGTPPSTYSWSNGKTTQLNNFLTANTYSVTITDIKGCTATGTYTVGYLGIGLRLLGEGEPATCPQPFDGAASVVALSGNGPYQYQWNNGVTQPAQENITAGVYDVTVSDINGCIATTSVTVEREDVAPTNVNVLIPQCAGLIYPFESNSEYHAFAWTLNDPADSIYTGEGTSLVEIKWGAPGTKQVTVDMWDTLTQCNTQTTIKVTVYECVLETTDLEQSTWKISPNPFNQFIDIQSVKSDFAKASVQVFDLHGRLMLAQEFTQNNTSIFTESWPSGIYLVRIMDETGVKTHTIVKQP